MCKDDLFKALFHRCGIHNRPTEVNKNDLISGSINIFNTYYSSQKIFFSPSVNKYFYHPCMITGPKQLYWGQYLLRSFISSCKTMRDRGLYKVIIANY